MIHIKPAIPSDAPAIHYIMIKAFEKDKNEAPPSSALEETVESISSALYEGERALIGYIDDQPVGMVRFQIQKTSLYFYRLSVLPEYQGKGFAKALLKTIEASAKQNDLSRIFCKVRAAIPKNVSLYHSIGYQIYNEDFVQKPNGVKIKVISMAKYLPCWSG